jgi:predicted small lipoprotein YifL
MRKILFAFVIITLLGGCGKKGVLISPDAQLPAPVNDLRGAQMGESFQLSWSLPTKEERGRALKDLAGFRLFKREVLPPDEDCESCPNAYRLLKSVDMEYLQDVRLSGGSLFFNDTDLITGTTCQYKVISFRKDGTSSRDSNKARLKKVAPPVPPRLTAHFSATGVLLHWVGGVAPAHGRLLGCNVYRWRANTLPALVPLNDSPVPGADYEDLGLERGKSYIYALRTVAEVAEGVVESELSNEVKGTMVEPE